MAVPIMSNIRYDAEQMWQQSRMHNLQIAADNSPNPQSQRDSKDHPLAPKKSDHMGKVTWMFTLRHLCFQNTPHETFVIEHLTQGQETGNQVAMNGSFVKPQQEGAHSIPLSISRRTAFRFSQDRVAGSAGASVARPPQTTPTSAATPPASRSRGRLLILLLLLAAGSGGILTVWDSLLRYKAYGVVTGHIINVATPIDGVVSTVHVREGELVRQDTPLAVIHDLKLEQSLARVTDELRVAEAELNAELAKVQWQSHVEETEMTRSIAEFFESTGRMHAELGNLELIREQLNRNTILAEQQATSMWEKESFQIQEKAATENLNAIQQSLVILKERAEKAASSPRLGAEQIQPLVAKSEMLLNEIQRIRGLIALGELKSPVSGTVLRRHHPAGECLKSHESLFSVIEESTLEIELFLPQEMSRRYQVGDKIDVRIDPLEELVACEVVSIGKEHRSPPQQIEIFYRSNIQLLPVRLKPLKPFADENKLPVGAVAKLPHIRSMF
ncbi:MAG: HlyD family efflux transporter periplasmic adaptor subunit [Planctomyces sp.]|nr:HlyD family efflux transporter periplasmic adaptor subunit [Planctomyces sp.]